MDNISKFIKYTGYFHDGTLIGIQKDADKIEVFMGSAEMDPEEMVDDFLLANDGGLHVLKGKLHLEEVKNVAVSNLILIEDLFNIYDDGTILDFDIHDKKVDLGILWTNFSPKPSTNDYSLIEITAERIWWENIPDLPDPFW